jgi:hypothetical protein
LSSYGLQQFAAVILLGMWGEDVPHCSAHCLTDAIFAPLGWHFLHAARHSDACLLFIRLSGEMFFVGAPV